MTDQHFPGLFNAFAKECHQIALSKGWHDDVAFLEDMMLIVTEVAEAAEDFRNGKVPTEQGYAYRRTQMSAPTVFSNDGEVWLRIEVPGDPERGGDGFTMMRASDLTVGQLTQLGIERKPIGIPSELADIIIRVGHIAAKRGVDLDRALYEKMEYNRTREFRHGGKKA